MTKVELYKSISMDDGRIEVNALPSGRSVVTKKQQKSKFLIQHRLVFI